jgi:hypothetical protein
MTTAREPGRQPTVPSKRTLPGDCRNPSRTEWLWVSALVGAVLLSRVAVIRYPVEMNVDESQMLAQAIRYTKDFMPWRGVDGTSSGPLNSWYLLLPHLFGMRLYYPDAHLLAAISWSASTLACWLAARFAFGAKSAMATAATMAAWLICQQNEELVQYSSEVLPVLLLSLALVGATLGGRGYYVAAGLLGLVPWSKLQAAPIGVVVGAWILARVMWPPAGNSQPPRMRRIRTALIVLGVSLLPTVILVAFVARGGALEEMWRSYIIANLYYSGPFDARRFASGLLDRELDWSIGPWSLGLLAIWGAGLALRRRWACQFDRLGVTALAWMMFLASWYVCARPTGNFEHYQFLLLPGLALLTAGTLGALDRDATISPAISKCVWVAIAAFLLMQMRPAFNIMRRVAQAPDSPVTDAKVVLSRIEKVAPGSQGILIWGWFPSLYVESGKPPPTRHAIAHFLYGTNPSREFLRSTFMLDLVAERPQVLVDAHNRRLDRIFNSNPITDFPALYDYVRAHFAWASHVDTSAGPVEIYARKN